MLAPNKQNSSIMAALEQFEAAEANLVKLERLWGEMASMIPTGVVFGENVEYEDRGRSFDLLLESLPKIGGVEAGGNASRSRRPRPEQAGRDGGR